MPTPNDTLHASRPVKSAIWSSKRTVIAIFALLSAACSATSGGPPEIVVDRTACRHCTMLISEPRYAAAYEAPGAEAKVFDDIACLLEAAPQEPDPRLRFWFHDGNDGRWIDQDAVFVVSPDFRTPMGGGIIAYRDAAAAEPAASRFRGRVVRSLPELIKERGEQ